MNDQVTSFEIAKLVLAPGDVLVVRVRHILSRDQAAGLGDYVKGFIPGGVKVVVMDRDTSFEVIKP